MLDLKRLRVLREVAERGSFSAAADSLYVSQSAISQQISVLEAEVGVPLLLRLRSGPVLTDAGTLLVSHADAAICRLEQAERELAELSGLGTGDLRLASFSSASATLVTRAARRFRDVHPEVRLSLTEADPEDSLPELKRGNADLAIAYDFDLDEIGADRDLVLTHLIDEEMHVALPPDHRLAGEATVRLEQLADETWLCGASEGSCRRLTVGSCERAGFKPDVAYESNDYTVMQALVAAGMGVTLIPDLALMLRNPGVAVVDVVPEPPIRRVWAVTLGAGSRSGATDAMILILADVAAEVVAGVTAPAAAQPA
jgi:DNA-binding transcriptional LysR family regulator